MFKWNLRSVSYARTNGYFIVTVSVGIICKYITELEKLFTLKLTVTHTSAVLKLI